VKVIRAPADKEGADGSKAADDKGVIMAVKKKQQEVDQLQNKSQEKDISPIAAIGSLFGKLFVAGTLHD
jgi:hypothetical protein